MKYFFAIVFIGVNALSTMALSQTIKTLKVIDGSAARCESREDFLSVRNRLGAYRAEAKNLKIADSKITFDLEVQFLTCLENKGTFSFETISPYQSYSYDMVDENGEMFKVQVEPVNDKAFLRAINDYHNDKLLFENVLPASGHTTFQTTLALEDVLEPIIPEYNLAPHVRRASLDFNVTRLVSLTNNKTGFVMNDIFNYGIIRVLVEFEE